MKLCFHSESIDLTYVSEIVSKTEHKNKMDTSGLDIIKCLVSWYEKYVYDLSVYIYVHIYIYEILIAKLRLTLKKVAKNTRPFRYDLNQILYDYTVEVKNKIQGLRFDRHSLKNYGQRFITLYRSQ